MNYPASQTAVIDVNEQNFRADVLEYSLEAPVIIDFWAPWCQPCKTLGPALEKLAARDKGAWRLAKVNIDEAQQLAMQFRIRSIPMVVAIFQGQIVDQFAGALPADQVSQFIDRVLEAAGIEPSNDDDVAPTDPAQAEAFWRAKLAKDSEHPRALLELGRLLLSRGDEAEAETLLQTIKPAMETYSAAQATLSLKALLAEVEEAGGQAEVEARLAKDPSDPEARYLSAAWTAAQARYVPALEVLVALSGSAPVETRTRARKAAAIVFEVAGRDNPEIETLRRKLARMLF